MARDNAASVEAVRIVGGASLLMFGIGIGAMKGYLVFVEGEPAPESALGVAATVLIPIGITYLGWRWTLRRSC